MPFNVKIRGGGGRAAPSFCFSSKCNENMFLIYSSQGWYIGNIVKIKNIENQSTTTWKSIGDLLKSVIFTFSGKKMASRHFVTSSRVELLQNSLDLKNFRDFPIEVAKCKIGCEVSVCSHGTQMGNALLTSTFVRRFTLGRF